jgi:PBP1b-binding outer membrane lipoprotein LpoB
MRKYRIAAASLLLMLLAGCATAPVQEMSDARQALLAAQQAGAPQSAPQVYARAKALMQSAEDQLGVGGYQTARNLAEQAKSVAQQARDQALKLKHSEP